MTDNQSGAAAAFHSHVFLGEGHEKSERKTWAVIWLCGAMMVAEIIGGLLFGSIVASARRLAETVIVSTRFAVESYCVRKAASCDVAPPS